MLVKISIHSLLALSADGLRVAAPRMGLLDGAKNVFSGDQPIVAADRVTPFDRWLGNDKELLNAEQPKENVAYIDPNEVSNYLTVELVKPMGIVFAENEGECGGVFVEEILDEGSASSSPSKLAKGDQLVGVDSSLVLGSTFDMAIDAIKDSGSASTRLVFFRGPTSFLYGPTKPDDDWYNAELLR